MPAVMGTHVDGYHARLQAARNGNSKSLRGRLVRGGKSPCFEVCALAGCRHWESLMSHQGRYPGESRFEFLEGPNRQGQIRDDSPWVTTDAGARWSSIGKSFPP